MRETTLRKVQVQKTLHTSAPSVCGVARYAFGEARRQEGPTTGQSPNAYRGRCTSSSLRLWQLTLVDRSLTDKRVAASCVNDGAYDIDEGSHSQLLYLDCRCMCNTAQWVVLSETYTLLHLNFQTFSIHHTSRDSRTLCTPSNDAPVPMWSKICWLRHAHPLARGS